MVRTIRFTDIPVLFAQKNPIKKMETFLPLIDQDPELLYLQLSDPSVSYTTMKTLCSVSHKARKLCATNRQFSALLHSKKKALLLHLPYTELVKLCDIYTELQDLCTDNDFWEVKTKRDFGTIEVGIHTLESEDWKSEYKIRLEALGPLLFRSIFTHDVDTVQELVDFGVNVDLYASRRGVPRGFGPPPAPALVQAIEHAHWKRRHETDPTDPRGKSEGTAPYDTIVKLLLDVGADINLQDYEGETPLMSAIVFEEPDLVQLLLSKGADFEEYVNRYQQTAFDRAVNSSVEILQLLIDTGADFDLTKAIEEIGWNSHGDDEDTIQLKLAMVKKAYDAL